MGKTYRTRVGNRHFLTYTANEVPFELQAAGSKKLVDLFDNWLVKTFPNKKEKDLDFSGCSFYRYTNGRNCILMGAFDKEGLFNQIKAKFKELEEKCY